MRSAWALALVGAALGLTPAAPIQDDEPPLADVRLTGRLLADPSRPLVHAPMGLELTVWQSTRRRFGRVIETPVWMYVAVGQFEDAGRFELEEISPGEATLRVALPGYRTLELEIRDLAPGETRHLGDLSLVPGLTLKGCVLCPDGAPVRGAYVRVDDPSSPPRPGNFGRVGKEDIFFAVSGREGEFEIDGLGDGPYSLLVTWRDGSGRSLATRLDGIPAGGDDEIVVLEPARTLAGRLLNNRGEPVSGKSRKIFATLVDVPTLHGIDLCETTGPEYRFDGLVRGRWKVRFGDDSVEVEIGDEDVVLDLRAAPDTDER